MPPTAVTDAWYGPSVDKVFIGPRSFHPMNGPLDVWIDDFVLDTKPLDCPTK